MIVTRIGRLLLIGLFFILSSQFTLSDWVGNGLAGAPSDPLQSQDQRLLEPVETEELTEDGDDRSAWQMELVAADCHLSVGCPVRSSLLSASNDHDQTQLTLLFRPPTLL